MNGHDLEYRDGLVWVTKVGVGVTGVYATWQEAEASTKTRYVVRDRATKGCDFLLWGDDDAAAAKMSLDQALSNGLDVELVAMPANKMDRHTARLIDG